MLITTEINLQLSFIIIEEKKRKLINKQIDKNKE
jgi:hypothetical protein